jgi:hypothetical protein
VLGRWRLLGFGEGARLMLCCHFLSHSPFKGGRPAGGEASKTGTSPYKLIWGGSRSSSELLPSQID